MNLVILSLAPVFIIAFYVYYRDKYEKEPVDLLIRALLAGILICIPVVFIERLLSAFTQLFGYYKSAYSAFVVASFTEELFKFAALYLLFWKNKNFNEKFDGMVYAVFISLGFAGLENVLYVYRFGTETGWVRAFTAVPLHAIAGIIMGYYFGLARFYPESRQRYLRLSLFVPILMHGMYDFILMSQHPRLLVLFIPLVIYFYVMGLRKMKALSLDDAHWKFRKEEIE